MSRMCWPCCAGCCRRRRWLGSCFRAWAAGFCSSAWNAADALSPLHHDGAAGCVAGLFALPFGDGCAPCNGSRRRISPSLASRTWWATSSGRSFSRSDSSPRLRSPVGRCRSRRSWRCCEKRSVLSASRKPEAGKAIHRQARGNQPGAGHRQAGPDRRGDGVFCRAAAVQRRVGQRRAADGLGRFSRLLFRRQRFLPGGAA